ncbi:hypothetical protein GRF59_14995 [Paenibacillus sp. HJL G12]|uniref:Uncharacterized protein n=1 Tax=Paenibacillus dendrobii TaxID=2691084 RepID=A0A7X3IMR5_9BACL|nr:hypothetical protein [Paenibacillus dendrobii]MWV44927.1 hypothetical protein [Paenibacillus dendrobii]
MKPENSIGKLIEIIDKESPYYGFWGFVRQWNGEVFHVSGGSIPEEQMPIFDRNQFKIPRNLEVYIRAGAKIDKDGRENN